MRHFLITLVCIIYASTLAAAQTQSASDSVTETRSPSASSSDSESPSASPSPSCTGNWTLYTDDDGSEGVDSCVAWLQVDANDWGSANAACPPGSHLLTIAAPSMPSALWNLSSTLAADCNETGFDGSAFIGCFQSSTSERRAVGWAWVDGTNADNLNCGDPDGGDGCGLWATNQPDDYPSPAEDHQQDVCRSFGAILGVDDIAFGTAMVCGAVCETELYVISPTPSVSDTASASESGSVSESASVSPSSAPHCPDGWTRYVDDDGSQGTDSCLQAFQEPNVTDWGTANSSCPAGSHLFTIRGDKPSALWDTAIAVIANGTAPVAFLGCYQSSLATERAAGWSWIDGTDPSNLNCPGPLAAGGNGCGIWDNTTGDQQPNDVSPMGSNGREEHHQDVCTNLPNTDDVDGGINDGNWLGVPSAGYTTAQNGFLCEMEIPTLPSITPSPSVSATDTESPSQSSSPSTLPRAKSLIPPVVGSFFGGVGAIVLLLLLLLLVMRRADRRRKAQSRSRFLAFTSPVSAGEPDGLAGGLLSPARPATVSANPMFGSSPASPPANTRFSSPPVQSRRFGGVPVLAPQASSSGAVKGLDDVSGIVLAMPSDGNASPFDPNKFSNSRGVGSVRVSPQEKRGGKGGGSGSTRVLVQPPIQREQADTQYL